MLSKPIIWNDRNDDDDDGDVGKGKVKCEKCREMRFVTHGHTSFAAPCRFAYL